MIGKGGHFIGRDFIASRELVGISVDEIAFTSSFSVVTKFVKQITTFSLEMYLLVSLQHLIVSHTCFGDFKSRT